VDLRPDGLRKRLLCLSGALALYGASVAAQGTDGRFEPELISKGSALFARNCAPCHGPRMVDPQSAFDLRKFPPDEKTRFVNVLMRGKNAMPPLGGLFGPDEIDALWAYVVAGEKR
jgi:mono/diheme cytochrome c family protein